MEDLEYLEELTKKYKSNMNEGSTSQSMLLVVLMVSILLLAVWVNSINSEQNRRSIPVNKMEQQILEQGKSSRSG